jgi:hypothetical protein
MLLSIGLLVKYPLSSLTVMKLEFSKRIFEKYSNNKFHDTPSCSR